MRDSWWSLGDTHNTHTQLELDDVQDRPICSSFFYFVEFFESTLKSAD